ncbi:MAG: hypothetical protein ACK5ME_02450 [Parahaliea sp.]
MQAAYHWQLLAANEAKLIAKKIPDDKSVYLGCASSTCGRQNATASTFDRTYRNLLISELVSNGVKVAVSDFGNTYRLSFSVDTVEHKGRDSLPLKVGVRSGVVTFFAALTGAANNWAEPSLALIPLAAAADIDAYWRDQADESVTEVVITTQVSSDENILSSSSSIYYFNAADYRHYQSQQSRHQMLATDEA